MALHIHFYQFVHHIGNQLFEWLALLGNLAAGLVHPACIRDCNHHTFIELGSDVLFQHGKDNSAVAAYQHRSHPVAHRPAGFGSDDHLPGFFPFCHRNQAAWHAAIFLVKLAQPDHVTVLAHHPGRQLFVG